MTDKPEGEGNGVLWLVGIAFFVSFAFSSIITRNSNETELNDIIQAKEEVRSQLNYPDTADFHDLETHVTSSHVILKVTAKNGFGIPETRTFEVPRKKD